jgi:hypothetical protein
MKPNPATKRCPRCESTLPLSDFALRRDRPCGVKSICLSCDRAKAKAYYEANREARLAHMEAKRRAAGVRPRGKTGPRLYKPRRSEND